MMNNEKMRLLLFSVITLLHGIIVYLLMYKMAIVSLIIADRKTAVGCMLWILYGTGIYLIEKHETSKQIVFGMIFGICVFICKGLLDMFVSHMEEIRSTSYIGIARGEAITNVLFGLCLIFLVKLITCKFHILFDKANAKWLIIPIVIVAVMACAFMYIDSNATQTIAVYQCSDLSELYQIDAQYAVKFLNIEVWLYVIFYISVWFSLDKILCENKMS